MSKPITIVAFVLALALAGCQDSGSSDGASEPEAPSGSVFNLGVLR